MTDEKWLVSVTAGVIQCHGIIEAKKIGLKVLSIDEDPNAKGFKISDKILNLNLSKSDEILKIIKDLNLNIIGAVSLCSDAGLSLCAKIREYFNLPGEKENTYRKFINKGVLRTILSENLINYPKWQVVSSTLEARSFIDKFNFPLIIKPTESSGSRGVSKINSKSQKNINFLIAKAFEYSKNNEVIIESYMDGYECTVETFTDKGITTVLAITEKLKVDKTDGLIASELRTFNRESLVYDEISNLIIKIIKILGYEYGPCHSEVIVTKSGKIGIVEIGARGGGFLVFNSLVPLISGINIAKLTILQSIGMEIKIGKVEKNHAILKFISPMNGKIKSISGFDKLNKIKGISAESFVKVGDNVKFSESDGDRLGYILSSGKSYECVEKLIKNNENLIKFVYDN